jgi:predicted dehydrogenase
MASRARGGRSESVKPMINAAIVGLGRWGRRLVDSVQSNGVPASSKLRFSHAVARTPSHAQEYADSQKLPLSGSLADILGNPSIDAIVLATPHNEHAAQIIAAANAKKHVFVEKPLAFRRDDAETALSAAKVNEVVLAVGYNRRFLPAAHKLKEDIPAGAFGSFVHLEGNFSNPSGFNFQKGTWRAAEQGAKAALSAMGVHVLDFFIYLNGPIKSVRTTSTRRLMQVETDGVVCVQLAFANGVTGTLSTMLTTPRQWRVQVFGSSQWVHMRDEHLLDICDSNGTVRSQDFEIVDTLRLELDAFADAIGGGTPYIVSAADALHGVAALQAILESSAKDGQPVVVS